MRRLILFLLASAALYVGYAALSVHGLAVGIEQRDANAIADHVDFPAVRASLKEQITSLLMTEAMAGAVKKNDPGAQIGAGFVAAFGPAIINNMVEGFVTPSGIAALLSRERKVANRQAAGSAADDRDLFDIKRFLEHVSILSPTRFRLADKEGVSLVFALEDWRWKVVEIRAPRDILTKTRNLPL